LVAIVFLWHQEHIVLWGAPSLPRFRSPRHTLRIQSGARLAVHEGEDDSVRRRCCCRLHGRCRQPRDRLALPLLGVGSLLHLLRSFCLLSATCCLASKIYKRAASINAALGIMTEDDWGLHVYDEWLASSNYSCACDADGTGHAMLHVLYGQAMKHDEGKGPDVPRNQQSEQIS